MTHLTPDQMIDAIEQALPASAQSHLDACAVCRQEVAQLAAVLRDLRATAVPEPSPLFWDRLSDRVRTAVAAEQVAGEFRWPQWLQWPVLAPLAALTLVIFALVNAVRVAPVEPAPLNDVVAEVPSTEESWALVSDIVSTFDLESIQEAGVATPLGSADRALLGLSAAQQQELVRLLEQELKESGS